MSVLVVPPVRSASVRPIRQHRANDCVRETTMTAETEPSEIEANDTVAAIGNRIRRLRSEQRKTLKALAERTGVSPSMLSLVERGKTSPSIGTLVAISSALGVHMSDLLVDEEEPVQDLVSRRKDQHSFTTPLGVQRRVLRVDRSRGLEIAINEYEPDSGSARELTHHDGYEYGVVLKGRLTIELEGEVPQELRAGDLIAYPSTTPHRIWNHSSSHVQALWLNLD
jgi:transcriptional regulator with XRE-family HTH domain